MTTLVAGATGTLGCQLFSELQRRGDRVRALVRDPARAGALDLAPAEIVVADLTDRDCDLDLACGGVRRVVSVAGRSCSTRKLAERGAFRPVDYEGNRRLLQAAMRAGAVWMRWNAASGKSRWVARRPSPVVRSSSSCVR